MVTDYTPVIDNNCSYRIAGLKDNVYLLQKSHLKNIVIDDGEAYITSLTSSPTLIRASRVSLEENTSIDERYRFEKTLTFSIEGYADLKSADGTQYAIVESKDGTFWLVNVDFAAKLTYTYTLDANNSRTDVTLYTLSNLPTLRITSSFDSSKAKKCSYSSTGAKSLKLLEREYCSLDTNAKTVTSTQRFKDIEYNNDSLVYTENYTGNDITSNISFDIMMDSYKSSWHYNLLEFEQNLYAAIIDTKDKSNTFYVGFNNGLSPLYTVNAGFNNDNKDIITISLTERSQAGTVSESDALEDDIISEKRWEYVDRAGNFTYHVCTGPDEARYLLMAEVDIYGNPTGNYKCLEGYEDYFTRDGLNIVGTFTDDVRFYEPTCMQNDECHFSTTIPKVINYDSIGCKTFNINSDCTWYISKKCPQLQFSTESSYQSGLGSVDIDICNIMKPTDETFECDLQIVYGIRTYNFKVRIGTKVNEENCFKETSRSINYHQQSVYFVHSCDCTMTVVSKSNEITAQMSGGRLEVNVPENFSVNSSRQFYVDVRNCYGNVERLIIIQDKVYERWTETSDVICIDGDSYYLETRYISDCSTGCQWNQTAERRAGRLKLKGDSYCSSVGSQTRWSFGNNFMCLGGSKFQMLEEEMSTDGKTWVKTGAVKPGTLVESNSSYCDESKAVYEWRLNKNKWTCEN